MQPVGPGLRGVFLQGSQEQAGVPVLALGAVEPLPLDVGAHRLRHQVPDALPPPQRPPDLGGGDVVGDPLFHQVNVVLVSPQKIGLVDEFLSVVSGPADAHQAVFFHDFSDVLQLPQIGDPKRFQHVTSTEQFNLWDTWKGKLNEKFGLV